MLCDTAWELSVDEGIMLCDTAWELSVDEGITLCDTAWELSVDEGIMLCGPLGTVLHGCEGHYLYHVRVHRHCVVSEDVLNSSAIVQEYLTYPLRQVAGRSCHSAQFLPCDNSDIDLQ